jgi:hypothetical protein
VLTESVVTVIKSKLMRWAGHVARTGKIRHAYKILVGKPKGKRSIADKRRCKDNIEMDIKGIGF